MREPIGYENKEWDFYPEREHLPEDRAITPLGAIDEPDEPMAVRARVVDTYTHRGVPDAVRLGGETGSISVYTENITEFSDRVDEWCVVDGVVFRDNHLRFTNEKTITWMPVNQRPGIETLVSKGRRRAERRDATKDEVIDELEGKAERIKQALERRLPEERVGRVGVRQQRGHRSRRTYYIRCGFNGVLVPEEVEEAAREIEDEGERISYARGVTPVLETTPVKAVPW